MAGVTYEVIGLRDAKERGLPCAEVYDDDIWGWGIWRCEDGVPVEYIGEDGGEPEDQSLVRDWGWVAPALQKAYARGFGDGLMAPRRAGE